jgi:hypothetical protein
MFYLNRDMAVGRQGCAGLLLVLAILSVGRSLSHRTGLVIVGESHSAYHFFVASAR